LLLLLLLLLLLFVSVPVVLFVLIVSKPPVCIDRVCIGSQYATSVTAHKKYVT
jgi:hypothetical protein